MFGNSLEGVFKLSDAFIVATSFLFAVAVSATKGADGKVAHNIASCK